MRGRIRLPPERSGRIERTIPFFIGTEPADVGMDDLTPVTSDYPAYDNEFTGKIRKIVVGVGPMGEAFDPPPGMAWPRIAPLVAGLLGSGEVKVPVGRSDPTTWDHPPQRSSRLARHLPPREVLGRWGLPL